MEDLFSFIKSLTVLIPLVIVLYRYNKIDNTYFPFIVYLVVATISEVVSYFFFIRRGESNVVVSNSYVLIEFFLILWLFINWGLFTKQKMLLYSIAFFVLSIWLTENIIYKGFKKEYCPFYRLFYSFILVLMSINVINYTIINDHRNILKNPRFLICIGFVIAFIYKILYEGTYQLNRFSEETRVIVIAIFGNVNVFQKILCAFAAWFIPVRKQF